MSEPKFCKDCKYILKDQFLNRLAFATCGRPMGERTCMVSGETKKLINGNYCSVERSSPLDTMYGPFATHFEERTE